MVVLGVGVAIISAPATLPVGLELPLRGIILLVGVPEGVGLLIVMGLFVIREGDGVAVGVGVGDEITVFVVATRSFVTGNGAYNKAGIA